jgi:hypothetical protein
MHMAEQAIVASAVYGLPATHIGSSCFDWYKRLPLLVGTPDVIEDTPSIIDGLAAVPEALLGVPEEWNTAPSAALGG